MIVDFDDFACNRIISDQCQSHDCRDQLDKFHIANPNFKATLFAIPGEMTQELLSWCSANNSWIELAVHGVFHASNYECENMTYDEMDMHFNYDFCKDMVSNYFVKGFRSPGWQTSPDVFEWLYDNGWWISCQDYDLHKLSKGLPAFVNHNGQFRVYYDGKQSDVIPTSHHHCWDVGWNGAYEQEEYILDLIKDEEDFKFVSEVVKEFVDA